MQEIELYKPLTVSIIIKKSSIINSEAPPQSVLAYCSCRSPKVKRQYMSYASNMDKIVYGQVP
jgi:hypothetical protein